MIPEEIKNFKNSLTTDASHYEQDENIYKPIIDKLISQGWVIDEKRCMTDVLGGRNYNRIHLEFNFIKK
jgi:hypothetical protein